ncbi:MAG: hypothetical protein WD066_04960 [Planctomycetaceae bacterium]
MFKDLKSNTKQSTGGGARSAVPVDRRDGHIGLIRPEQLERLDAHWPHLWQRFVQLAGYDDSAFRQEQFLAYVCSVVRDKSLNNPGGVIAKALRKGPRFWMAFADAGDYQCAKALIAGQAEQLRRRSAVRPGDKLGHVDRGGIVRETPATFEDALRIARGERPGVDQPGTPQATPRLMNDFLRTAATVEIEAAAANDKPARVKIVAYNGGPIRVHGFASPVLVELQGIDADPSILLLLDHKQETAAIAGTGRPHVEAKSLIVDGTLSRTDAGRLVRQLAADGIELKASIGAGIVAREFIPPGKSITANGRTHTADRDGLLHVTASRLSEVSILPIGADATSTVSITGIHAPGTPAMPEPTTTNPNPGTTAPRPIPSRPNASESRRSTSRPAATG